MSQVSLGFPLRASARVQWGTWYTSVIHWCYLWWLVSWRHITDAYNVSALCYCIALEILQGPTWISGTGREKERKRKWYRGTVKMKKALQSHKREEEGMNMKRVAFGRWGNDFHVTVHRGQWQRLNFIVCPRLATDWVYPSSRYDIRTPILFPG